MAESSTSYREFSLPSKLPEPSGQCNTRIWVNGEEKYCDRATRVSRCALHSPFFNGGEERVPVIDEELLKKKVAELQQDPKNLTELDDEILKLAAAIDYLEEDFGLQPHKRGERASLIASLKKTKAELIEKKIDIEYKRRLVLNPDSVWQRVKDILDSKCPDEETKSKLREAFLVLIDEMAEGQKK